MKKLFSSLLVALLGFTLIACDDVVKEENEIKVYTRDTTSGTRGAFFEIVDLDDLAGSNEGLAQGFVEVESNGSMMNSVRNDEFGIGYISLSGLAESGLKGLAFNGVEATEANVLNDTYTLKRPFMYIRKADQLITNEDEKALVNAFLAFMETNDGKAIIANEGGIAEGLDEAPTWASIAADHPVVESTGANIEIHFGGSTSVESIGRALSEAFSTIAPRFNPVHAHAGSSAAFSGTREDGNFHIGFASRDLNATELAGLNDGEFGRLSWDAVVIVVNNLNTLN
ncbi:MAG TPA: hypothetical protein GX742_02685, partial [Acholeplasmataceae bacterium]|nr:hypothetical protein [Acholeplasmataceae bacterium]